MTRDIYVIIIHSDSNVNKIPTNEKGSEHKVPFPTKIQ